MRLKQCIFALVAMMSFTFSALAQTTVTTEDELKAAMSSGGEVTLGADIGVTEMIVVPTGVTATLDLNGHAITVPDATDKHIYAINNQGVLTITDGVGDGSIDATFVAQIGSTTYATLAEALTAASAMSGDVTIEVYDKVTLNTAFSGSYSSINFVGKDTDAEIYLDVQGYITATGKKVSFTGLTLSKSVGVHITNAGFMNVAFGIYDVTEVTYTNCVFANGAYASSGNVTFNDCKFYRSHDKYGLWAYGNVDVAVEGCTFADYRGIKMYAEGAAKTVDLTVKNTDFSALTGKPAIVLTYGESVVLEDNTYSGTGTFELDLDGAPNGTAVTSDVAPTCKNDNGACGVLVDGKIYTTVAQAAEVATGSSTVTLLHSSTETVLLPEGSTLVLNGFTAPNVTVEVSLAGEGTEASPYLISSVADLETLRNKVNAGNSYEGKFVKLAADLTLTEAWTPIGNGTRSSKSYNGNAFKGTFDGDNNTISGLKITSTTGNDAAIGLFGVVDGGTVKNLTLNNVDINVANSDLAGGAIGLMLGGATAENITVNGAIVGNDGVGGIVGRLVINGTIKDCTNNASVTSSYGGIGGIVGKAYYEDGANTTIFASIDNCTNNGTVTAPMYVGGIVGLARANVTDCVNNGPVVGGTQTGGIIGQLIAAGTVSGNENKAKITGKNHLGGIIGDYTQSNAYTYYNVAITNNINRGELAATEQCAAIMGCNNIDGFTAMTATGNLSYYFVEGLELFGNPEDMVIDATNKFVVPVAKVGENVFTTVLEALQYAIDNNAAELKILCDVREKMTTDCYLKINADLTITADAPVKVEFYNDGTTYDFVVGSTNNNTLTIGENVHFDLVDRVIWLGYWGNDVTVVVNGYLGGYQIWHGANTVVNGTLDSHGEAFVMRRNATLTANEGAKVNANYFQIYSGHIVAENATITAGLVWVNNNHNYGIEGTVSFELDNTEFTSNGEVKIYAGEGKIVSVTLENSSLFDAKGVVTLGDNVKVVADATSSIQDANGSVVIPVAKIGDTKYATLDEAFGAATEGATITLLADATPALTSQRAITKAAVIDLGGNTLTLTEDDLYFGTTTFKNGTIVVDPSVSASTAVFWMFANQTLTFDDVDIIATGLTGTYLIGINDGTGSSVNLLNGSSITIDNSEKAELSAVIADNGNGNSVIIKDSNIDVKNVDARLYLGGQNGSVTIENSDIVLNGVKEGFYLRAGQTLAINGTSKVDITLNADTKPRYGINISDATATYTKAETATVNATVYAPATGSNSFAYTKEENGYVRVWGEGGGNAKESYELKLYSGETLIATTKLNNVDNVIDGDVYVTWNFYYPESNDEYWTTTWEEGHPNSAAQPTKVELYIDGTLVATTAAKMSGADDVAPVVWRNLGGVAIANLLGEGTETSPYLISNKKELMWLQAKVDKLATDGSTQFAGKYFKLTADIDLAGENWNPIGSMSGDHGSFKGVFDGGDHTISNLKVEQAGNGIGLFARTTGNAVIKNLKLNNVSVKSTNNSNYVGAVVGNAYASTKIENVHVSGNVLVSGRGYIGGIAGHGYVVMDNVSVVATGDGQGNDKGLITSTFWCAGGILGYAGEGATNIMNANVENVVVTSAAGGLGAIVGMAEDNNGTQPISGSNLSAKNVEIKTYNGGFGHEYANYALGYLYGGNPTSKLTGELSVENVTLATFNGVAPTPVDAVAKVNDAIYFSLQKALNAAAAGTGNVTVEILSDVNLTGIDWNPVKVSAPGYPVVTVEGNNKTITGLNDMLFAGTWAGKSGLIIKNLTIAESAIVNDKDDANVNVGVGAFIGFPQASEIITLENCHLVNSSVEGGHWTGGLIGYAAGYAGNDGPVFMNLTVKGCSVTGSTITGKGSVGGIIGHGSGNGWTNVVIEETTVENNTITSTGSSTNKAGAIMGTIGAAGQPTTVNGVTNTGGASVSATVAGNTVKSNGTAITTIYGRQGTDTGLLYVAGGSYDNNPIEENVAYAKPAKGYKIVQNTDGTYGVAVDPAYGKVAMIGAKYYETLDAAFAAAQDNDEVKIIAAGTYALTTSGKNITITGAVEGVVFDNIGAKNMGGANVTFNKVTFDYYPNVDYTGLQHSGDLTYNECIINGQVFLYGTSETFNKCTFNQNSADAYNVWTYGAKDVDFNECIFNSVGKSVLVYTESPTTTNDVAFTKCELNASAPVEGKAAIEIDTSRSAGATITVDGETTANGFGSGNVSGNSLWNNKKGNADAANNDVTIVVNGETVLAPIPDVAKIGETGYRTLAEAIAAAKPGETVKVFAGTYPVPAMKAGITIEGAVNADGTPAVLLEGTLKGTLKNLTLKNLHIKGGNAQRYAYANGNLVFENVTFEATSVYALHFDGITEGTNLTYKNCTIIGWAALGGSPASCVFDGCTIKDNGAYGVIRTYFDATIKNCTFDVANANTGDVYQDGIHAVDGAEIVVDDCTNANGEMKDLVNVSGASVVTVDGVEFKNVAKIGDKYYATINEAIAAAKPGEIVTIVAGDYAQDINVNKVITLQGATSDVSTLAAGTTDTNLVNITGRISVSTGATVKNLNVNNTKTGDYDCAMVVNGKDIVVDNVKLTGYNAMRYCYATGNITIKNSTINGSEFAVHFDGSEGGNIAFENCDITGWCSYASTVAAVSYTNTSLDNGNYAGHRYYNKNISFENCEFSEGMQIDLRASGTNVAFTDDSMTAADVKALFKDPYYVAKGNVTLNGDPITYVASAYTASGSKYFDSLQDAINEVNNGGYITVRSDIALTAPVTVPAGKALEIGLGDFNITYTSDVAGEAMINNKGELTISGNGKVVYTYNGAADAAYSKGNYTITNSGKLTIDGVTVENATAEMKHASYAINNGNNGQVIIKKGLVLNTNNYAVRQFGAGSITVDGGEVKGTRAVWLQAPGSNTADAPAIALTVNGGKLTATGEAGGYKLAVYSYNYGNSLENVSVTITGGELDGDVALSGGANKTVAETVTVTGGTITDLYSYAEDAVAENSINVSGGTFKNAISAVYCKEGFMCQANGDGTFGIVVDPAYGNVAKIGDTYYATINEALEAAQKDDIVTILAGNYTQNINVNKDITVVGETDAEGNNLVNITGKLNITADGATVKNLNVNNGSSTGGYINAKNVTVEDCQVVGGNGFRNCYTTGNVTFRNSVITGSTYGIHFDGNAGGNIVIEDCTITGWTSFASTITNVALTGTKFEEGNYNYVRFYQDAQITNCTFNEKMGVDIAVNNANVTVENSTVEGGKSVETLFNGADMANSNITVDGVKLVRIAKIGGNYYATLADAIAAIGAGDVVIELLDNATFDYNARDAYGTAETTSVTINGNGHTLTLNQKNSDWASIGLANAAGKLVLNDMTIEKTGYGDTSGAWNTHAIIFSCPVEMTDVTVNNGIAVQAGATLNNVTINEANGYYGLWINGNGQSVTVNGGEINATNGGRGIKIADEYIASPAKVTLNVTDTEFSTAKKAAVLVSSKAGADIAASNVNIENVAEDKVNFVWVDEDWAQYFANVTVTGATLALESMGDFAVTINNSAYFKTLAAAIKGAKSGETITFIKNINENVTVNKNVTIDGAGKQYTGKMAGNDGLTVTVKNVAFVNAGFVKDTKSTNGTYTFTDCTFDGAKTYAYPLSFRGANTINVENCTVKDYASSFLYVRSSALNVNVKNVTVENCPSYAVYFSSGVNSATFENLTVKNSNNGFVINNTANRAFTIKDCKMENVTTAINYSGGTNTITCTALGVNDFGTAALSEYAVIKGATITGTNYYGSVKGMVEKAENGQTVQLISDITLDTNKDELASCDGYPSFAHVESKAVTVDLNGKAITADAHAADLSKMLIGVFSTDNGGMLTLVDSSAEGTGSVTLNANDAKVYSLICNYEDGCNITINGGTYVADKLHDCLVYSGGKSDALVTVNGGNFKLDNVGTGENGKPWIFNVLGAGDHHILVKGGTFNADINRQHWSNEVYVHREYYTVNNGDGTYTIKEGAVAYVGEGMLTGPYFVRKDVGYATLGEAFAAADDNDKVTLLKDITYTKETGFINGEYVDGLVYTGDKSFTVDFNGKTVTDDGCVNDYLIYINNKGEKASEITFTNGTIVSKNGCWSAVCVNSNAATQNVVLNLNGMNITNSNDAEYSGNPVVRVRNLATVNVNDKTVITSNGASYGVAANTDGSTLNINEGATIVQQNSGTTGGNSVFAAVGGKGVINIKGGTITSDKYGVHTMTTGTPVINISGGTITAPVALKSSTNGGNGELATINVTGGTINGTLETHTENGKIVVSGGVFNNPVKEEFCAEGYAPLDNEDGTYGVIYALLDNFEIIDDGGYTEFENPVNMTVKGKLTYERDLQNVNVWQAFYVPFEIPVDKLGDDYDVVYINNMVSRDLNGDAKVDTMYIELIDINYGTLKANYPYLIRAKNDDARSLKIELENNVTLYSTKAESQKTVECSSALTKFEFVGTYNTVTRDDLADKYGSDKAFYGVRRSTGNFAPMSSTAKIDPFRLYMVRTEKDGSPVIFNNAMPSIGVRLIGEENEDGTTTIYDVFEDGVGGDNMIYDLNGRRVLDTEKGGIYITNGKKVLVK